jgi:hypothetical protein
MSGAQQDSWITFVDNILENVYQENRNQLFKHEVYEIAAALGIKTTNYIFVRDKKAITRNTLTIL